MANRISLIGAILFIFFLGGWASWYFFTPKSNTVEEAQVMLERIRTVMKLVTVEGQFSELFSNDDYQGAFSFFWEKKMLVRVTATVSAGYDLEKVKIETDAQNKTIKIGPLPAATILSIDDKVDYYDISEGLFTSFSPQDFNRINERVEQIIREKAQASLLPSAEEQGRKTLDMLKAMIESAGWKVEIVGESKGR
jgi:Protein of unknown function (DUF4230)